MTLLGVLSVIGSAISAAGNAFCSGVGSICSSIGGALFGAGTGSILEIATAIVGPYITMPEIGAILVAIQAVATIVNVIAEVLGLKEKGETPEELGMKAEKADKTPEDFESTEKYIEYLRKEVEIDQKKAENLSDEDRAKYGAIGIGLYIKGIEERYGIEAPGDFWRVMAELKLNGEDVRTYIEAFRENGIDNMEEMSNYIKGAAPRTTAPEKVSDAMIAALRNLYPGLSEDEAYNKLAELSL